MGTAYADASALVKLSVAEAESTAMHRWWSENERVMTSVVGIVETIRAVARTVHDPGHLRATIASVAEMQLTPQVLDAAARVGPPVLRTLDAIHLASALALGPELDAFATYDDRLAAAARQLGLPVVRPA